MKNELLRFCACLCGLLAPGVAAFGGATGLNTIPTTDTIHYRRAVLGLGNGNTSFQTPTFSTVPHLEYGLQFGLDRRVEAGVDAIQPDPDSDSYEASFNIKDKLRFESATLPSVAVGIGNVGARQHVQYYLTLSKTLNYLEKKRRERAEGDNTPDPTIHHHTSEFFGRRVHAVLFFDGKHTLQPFLGADVEIDKHWLAQADWINGSGNAITLGAEYTFPNKKTAINPALLYSNDTHRIDGFALSISDEFRFHPFKDSPRQTTGLP